MTQGDRRARLVLMGAGPQKEELEATVKRLGLESVVHFPGFRRDASQLLPALDVFVLSSLSEGISLALLEAMAAGVPSVATSVGGNLEIISDPACGLLVPPRSPRDLADAILSLMDDRHEAAELMEGGRRRVEEAFSLRRMVGAYGRCMRASWTKVVKSARPAAPKRSRSPFRRTVNGRIGVGTAGAGSGDSAPRRLTTTSSRRFAPALNKCWPTYFPSLASRPVPEIVCVAARRRAGFP